VSYDGRKGDAQSVYAVRGGEGGAAGIGEMWKKTNTSR
jgi:hypothetical protein